jgi:predicted ATPase
LGFASVNAWSRGYTDVARERMARANAFARASKNPYEHAMAVFFEGCLYQFLREPQLARDASAQSLAISKEHGFSYLRDLALSITGFARAQLGSPNEGVALIRQGLAGEVETGGKLAATLFLTSLAEAQALDGAIADALGTIENALQANPVELVYRPDALKCRGDLRLKLGQPEQAEADFREAIALAQKMSAKFLELHATMSLARLMRDTGRCDEPRSMLAEIYNWFTEGFDSADLKDAKALLDELSR